MRFDVDEVMYIIVFSGVKYVISKRYDLAVHSFFSL